MLHEQFESSAGMLSKLLLIIWLGVLFMPGAHAVPSYSRQTGLACASCHYAPPELTPFGRKFKLEGYTFTTKAEVTDEKKDHNAALACWRHFRCLSSSTRL